MAELRTKRGEEVRMSSWRQNVDQIISSNGFPVLTHAGKVRHARWSAARTRFIRTTTNAANKTRHVKADQQDEAELKALENTLKKRPKL